jgi:hypothetical protein
VLCPKATHCAANKNKKNSLALFGVYLIFLFFSIILESLKKNKRMIRYKGGMSVKNILVLGAKTRWMFRERTLGKIPPAVKVVKTQRQSATGLAYKACFRWFN